MPGRMIRSEATASLRPPSLLHTALLPLHMLGLRKCFTYRSTSLLPKPARRYAPSAAQSSEQMAEDLWTMGPLLHAVQTAPLFSDSKTFV